MKKLYFIVFFFLSFFVVNNYCYAQQDYYLAWNNEKILSFDNITSPDISPDGSMILFLKEKDEFSEIWVANIDGSSNRSILSTPFSDYSSPKWSPDGKKIIYLKKSGFEMWIVNADGTGNNRISSDKYELMDPVWLPGGKQIIYYKGLRISYEEGEDRGHIGLYLLNLDNNTSRPIGEPQLDGPVAFSSDNKTMLVLQGKKLIFLNANGTLKEIKQLVKISGRGIDGPVWTPDGKYIILNNLLYVCATGEEVPFLPDSVVRYTQNGKPDLVGPDSITLSKNGKKIAFVLKYVGSGVSLSKIKTMDVIWK